MIGICLGAAAGAATVFISASTFTLRWEHTVEHTPWEEDYRVEADRLVLTQARIQGSGAGMEPPPDAVLRGGVWHYRPPLQPLAELRLTVSAVGDYDLCAVGRCWPLSALVDAAHGETVVVRACEVRSN